MIGNSYVSSEDSALLRSVLEGYSGGKCLEIGTGNAGGLIALAKGFRLVVGTDLVTPSDDYWRGSSATLVLADAASCFRDGSFDLVAFNPPYVPSGGREDMAVDGGADGLEVALSFLAEAMRVVRKGGRILMLLSSYNPLGPVRAVCEKNGFTMELVGSRRLFYETLSVYAVSCKE